MSTTKNIPENLKDYRPGAGVVLFNAEGKVFIGERSDIKEAWQFPQGGWDTGETMLQTAKRELLEETGITEKEYQVIAEHSEWLTYDWAKPHPKCPNKKGVAQKWFLLKYVGEESKIDVKSAQDAEFARHKWTSLQWAEENIVKFKREIYAAVVAEFQPIIQKNI